MRAVISIIAALLLSVVMLVCAAFSFSLSLFPFGSMFSMEDVVKLEKVITVHGYLMVPLVAGAVGFLSGLAGVRRCGLAGVVAVLPTLAVFVSGSRGSVQSFGFAVILAGLAWVIAHFAGRNESSVPASEAFASRHSRRLLTSLRRRGARHSLPL